MNKKPYMRSVAILCAAALASSAFFASPSRGAIGYSDEKYYDYANIDGAIAVPTLFRQDTGYANDAKYPLVIKNGVEFVPLEIFFGFRGVIIEITNSGYGVYIYNKNNKKNIFFDIKGGTAVNTKGEVINLATASFYGTTYVPARATTDAIGLVCETYTSKDPKLYCVRVHDGMSRDRFSDLVDAYVSELIGYAGRDEPPNPPSPPQKPDPPVEPVKPALEENKKEEEPEVPVIGRRNIYFAVTGCPNDGTEALLDCFKRNGIKAVFFCTEERMLAEPALVRRIIVEGHGIGLEIPEALLAAEDGADVGEALSSARDTLRRITKKGCRMYLYTEAMAEKLEPKTVFESMGLVSVQPNVICKKGFNTARPLENLAPPGNPASAVVSVASDAENVVAVEALVNYTRVYPQVVFLQLKESLKPEIFGTGY